MAAIPWPAREYEQQEHQQREAVIAEFDAGTPSRQCRPMAAEVLRDRHAGHVRFHCLRTLLSLWVGQPWAKFGQSELPPWSMNKAGDGLHLQRPKLVD